MNAVHILFKTSRFNLSKVGEHFISPCCFGEDLAYWLRLRLEEKNMPADEPNQEDWGWGLPVTNRRDSYYLGLSGNADAPGTNPNEGEWRIIIEKRRSIWQRLAGRGRIAWDDEMVGLLEQILFNESSIANVHRVASE
jgi:hypothetical protein